MLTTVVTILVLLLTVVPPGFASDISPDEARQIAAEDERSYYLENPLVTGAEIQINAENVLHTLSPRLIGVNVGDLNNECYGGVYSQLIYGESFEEHVDPNNILGLTGKEQLQMHIRPIEGNQYELWGFAINGKK